MTTEWLTVDTKVRSSWNDDRPYALRGIIVGFAQIRDVDDEWHPAYLVKMDERAETLAGKYPRWFAIVVMRTDRVEVEP